MKKRKRKLRKWVKVILVILLGIILGLMIEKGVNDFNEMAKQCDQDKGYTCSYYEVRQYSLGK